MKFPTSAIRWFQASDLHRVHLILGLLALGLGLWLIFDSSKPWAYDTANIGNWRLRDFVGYYSFWAGALNFVGLVLLGATAKWWLGDRKTGPALLPAASLLPVERSRLFWPAVIGAVLFCGVCAGIRMNFGFAHDENYSAKRIIAGEYKVNKEGEVALKPVSWQETFFYYRKPNNHMLHSVLSRVCWTVWQAMVPSEGWHMTEWVIRTPAFLAGLGAIGALALLMRKLVSARVGIIAAWLLALHPWHIRYASEARGYSLLMLLISVIVYLWIRALETNRWRWWLPWAVAQFLLVFCYPGAVYVLVVLNVLCAAWLIARSVSLRSWTGFFRWFVANVFAAMLALQATLPLVPQLKAYMQTGEARLPLTLSWFQSVLSHFYIGSTWFQSGLEDSPYQELQSYALDHPILYFGLAGLVVLFLVVGYGRLFTGSRPLVPIAAATLLLPGLIGLGVAVMLQQWLFEWYLIYLLPGLVAGVAVGTEALARMILPARAMEKGAWAVGGGMVLAYGALSQPFRAEQCLHPLDTIKDAAYFMRGTADPNDPSHINKLTVSIPGSLSYYDPRAVLMKNPEELLALMKKADAENKSLSIMVGHPWACVFKTPQLWRLFNESGLFRDFRLFRGYDNTRDWIVARYEPNAVNDFDLESFLRGRTATPDPNLPPLAYPSKPELHP